MPSLFRRQRPLPLARPPRRGYDYAYDNPVMFTDPTGLCLSADIFAKIKAKVDSLLAKLEGDGEIVDFIRRMWRGTVDLAAGLVCAAEEFARDAAEQAKKFWDEHKDEAKQCALWGGATALAGGGPVASIFACAAGAFASQVNPTGDDPFSQCGAWAAAGIRGGIPGVAIGCVTAAAASLAPKRPVAQCTIWGQGGIASGQTGPGPKGSFPGKLGIAQCLAGALGPFL